MAKNKVSRKKILKALGKIFSKHKYFILPVIFFILVSFTLGVYVGQLSINNFQKESLASKSSLGIDLNKLQEKVMPQKGYDFKIQWGDLGKKMVEDGVIDEVKLANAVAGSDKLPADLKKYLDGSDQKRITVNQENAQFWVDVLWGLGLANKNEILEKGPMQE